MADRPWIRPNGVVLDSPDAQMLASFWQRLTGWARRSDEPDWVTLAPPGGGVGLSFQSDPGHVRPVWPAGDGDPQMQVHLDVEVRDLAVAVAWAESLGAEEAAYQPQDRVRVMLDPAGHPFCLWVADDGADDRVADDEADVPAGNGAGRAADNGAGGAVGGDLGG